MRPSRLLALISAFSALVAFKPSEPFLVSYMHCVKLIPSHDVIHQVFPVWTYAYLALLPCMSVLAELIGYRLVVLTGVLGRILTLAIILLPLSDGSLPLMQLSQVTVAMGFAAHPSLSAIMFRTLPASAYARAAGVVASAGVLSEVIASLLGQLMLSQGSGLTALFVVSCGATAAALLLTCALPSPATRWSLKGGMDTYAAPQPSTEPPASADVRTAESCSVLEDAAIVNPAGRADLTAALLSPRAWSKEGLARALVVCGDIGRVLRESSAIRYYSWFAVGTAVHHLVLTYWQACGSNATLAASPCGKTSAYNGYTQAAASFLGGGVVLLPLVAERLLTVAVGAKVRFWLVMMTPLVMALLLAEMSVTQNDAVFSSCYVLFHVTFEFMRVICIAEAARCVASVRWHGPPRFALIGGLSLTVALSLQTLLQLVFDQLRGTTLPLSMQFRIFAGLFVLLHLAYVTNTLCCMSRCAVVPQANGSSTTIDAGTDAYGGTENGSEAEARCYREITNQ
ncbi:hypothetical protein AB1Y20_020424 [Prymnesium parvum]|uniref:Solute carrier family 40 protein n=1 Tax=Prymnesium parvum TaxID=97485 RepID=A0AB34JUK1_PRYPA